jgi:hypothetical protein
VLGEGGSRGAVGTLALRHVSSGGRAEWVRVGSSEGSERDQSLYLCYDRSQQVCQWVIVVVVRDKEQKGVTARLSGQCMAKMELSFTTQER